LPFFPPSELFPPVVLCSLFFFYLESPRFLVDVDEFFKSLFTFNGLPGLSKDHYWAPKFFYFLEPLSFPVFLDVYCIRSFRLGGFHDPFVFCPFLTSFTMSVLVGSFSSQFPRFFIRLLGKLSAFQSSFFPPHVDFLRLIDFWAQLYPPLPPRYNAVSVCPLFFFRDLTAKSFRMVLFERHFLFLKAKPLGARVCGPLDSP